MGKIGLKIKANLLNIDKLYPSSPEQFCWALKIKCTGCGEENPNWHLISQEDEVELVNATANFLCKCKFCSRENSLSIIPSNHVNPRNKGDHHKKNLDTFYTDEDDDKFKMIISFDCRGLELIDFDPRDGWSADSGKKVFNCVDLSSKEWVDYNDVDNVPVEINNFEYKFESLK